MEINICLKQQSINLETFQSKIYTDGATDVQIMTDNLLWRTLIIFHLMPTATSSQPWTTNCPGSSSGKKRASFCSGLSQLCHCGGEIGDTSMKKSRDIWREAHLAGWRLASLFNRNNPGRKFQSIWICSPKQGQTGSCLLHNRVVFRSAWRQITSHWTPENCLVDFWTVACF